VNKADLSAMDVYRGIDRVGLDRVCERKDFRHSVHQRSFADGAYQRPRCPFRASCARIILAPVQAAATIAVIQSAVAIIA